MVLLLLDTISRQFSAFALEELVRHLQMTRDLSLVQRRGLVTVIAVSSSRDRNNVAGFSITGTFSAFLKWVDFVTPQNGPLARAPLTRIIICRPPAPGSCRRARARTKLL